MIAAGLVANPGFFVSEQGFDPPIAHVPGSGVYVLTLTNPPPTLANAVVTALLSTNPGTPGQVVRTADIGLNMITIETFNAAGVPTDLSFNIVVHDVT